uniref:CWH43-like N-terminal domain-containing protein n=1 Tax=Trichobilharzia regenti TaxID=157069 RepID=A0AA85JZB6_TRIRE|nr:unnamed protein product [Trichobilharzia regenti]
MEWPKFYPSRIPLFAVIHASVLCPIMYIIAIYHDRIQPVVPYVSALGIHPPEKYIFIYSSGVFAVLNIISQWFWYLMTRRRLVERNAWSMVSGLLCIIILMGFAISSISIIGLAIIDAKTDNDKHYDLAVRNFCSHLISIPLGALLVLYSFRPWKWFFLARIIVWIQMILGAFFFVYFNQLGLLYPEAEDFYYIKSHEPGYEEFKWSAVGEWFVVLGIIETSFITSLELRNYEREIAYGWRRSKSSWRA